MRISHLDPDSFALHHSEFDIDMSDTVACRPCSHIEGRKVDTQMHVRIRAEQIERRCG